ncbi:unnamed protein product [Kluyveromyces dobzhanskii CBS 2104]|uniref:WGS project CCBQ000000000 data, contig 00107 n=1 Tax=Kluyveromyces dobzhanskii CBS 2104 TaxID=1427455 RepID=A0A0A8L0M9_9SACH|nr:unnamed protein product [Kluyveromyces dobzhanskii CBS 2104]
MSYTDRYNVQPLIPLPEYLFHRLFQLNCRTVFGVANYSTAKLYNAIADSGLQWIQTINQLNTSFAVDAYGRTIGISCYITSESAELGHVNGFFGSFCEYVPILQVVVLEQSHDLERLIGDVSIFHDIVDDPSEIDNCVRMLFWGKRPVYMGLRSKDTMKLVHSSSLNTSIYDKILIQNHFSQKNNIQKVIQKITSELYSSTRPLIVVDALIDRYDYNKTIQSFLTETGIPFVTTLMSKGAINESLPNFVGTFLGTMSQPIVREYMNNADCTLILGCMIENFKNSYCRFTYKSKNQILLWSDRVKIESNTIPDILLHELLPQLISSIDTTKIASSRPVAIPNMIPRVEPQPVTFLRQEYLWFKMSTWLQEGDVIISESGTSAIGLLQQKFPDNTRLISQAIWNSSGYSIGACLGVLTAYRDMGQLNDHRIILIVGDGSLQFTFQELSTILTHGFKPYIFIINNQGYTVDRTLNKEKTHLNATYFDIQPWELLKIPSLFSSREYFKRKCMSVGELNGLLSDKEFNNSEQLKIVELILPSMDVPVLLDSRDESSDDESSPQHKRIKI